jgi:acyl carrier protein
MSTRSELIDFLHTIARPDGDVDAVADEDDLVESNIIDSLAIVQIVIYLETVHQMDVRGVEPTALVSIAGILSVLDR